MDFGKGTFQTVLLNEGEAPTLGEVISFLSTNPYWGWKNPSRLIRSGGVRASYKHECIRDFKVVKDYNMKIDHTPLYISSDHGRRFVVIKTKEPSDIIISIN